MRALGGGLAVGTACCGKGPVQAKAAISDQRNGVRI